MRTMTMRNDKPGRVIGAIFFIWSAYLTAFLIFLAMRAAA